VRLTPAGHIVVRRAAIVLEQRRILLARLPQPLTEPAARHADALRAVTVQTDTQP
jgi:hypothetical protein